MRIANYKLLNTLPDGSTVGLIPALSQLASLKTGVKVGYNVAYTLKKATDAFQIVEGLQKGLRDRYEAEKEQVDKEWQELMLQDSEFEGRTIKIEDLENIQDQDKITPGMLMQLEGFVIE